MSFRFHFILSSKYYITWTNHSTWPQSATNHMDMAARSLQGSIVYPCVAVKVFGGIYTNCANGGHELQKIFFILKGIEFIEVNDLCVILFAEIKFKDAW